MALSFDTDDGRLVIPQAAAKWETAPSNSGLATRGVVVLVGEADLGESYSEETDGLVLATFGPGQFKSIQTKYGAGPLVDAARIVCNPSRDPAVRGAPTSIICVKTNTGTKASGAFTAAWATAQAKKAGAPGNLLSVQVTAGATEVPAFLEWAYVHNSAAETSYFAANGGTRVAVVFGGTDPAAFKAANLAGLAAQNIAVTGGVKYSSAPAGGGATLAVTVASPRITITVTGGVWTTTPLVGQTLIIPVGSNLSGAGNADQGQYIVTAATATTITAEKVRDLGGGAPTLPVVAIGGPVASAAAEFDVYTKVKFASSVATNAAKTIVYDTDAGSVHFYSAAVTSVAADAYAYSTVEVTRNILVQRSYDAINETWNVGGDVVISIGKTGTATVPVLVGVQTIDFNSAEFVVTKTNFKTIGDLAAFINSKVGWFAYANPAFKSLPLSVLDRGTYDARQNNVASVGPARIKKDAYDAVQALVGSRGIEFLVAPTADVPAIQAVFFLTGGARGATTDAGVTAALVKAGTVKANFVVSCFSQDASADITEGITDATSTYTIDGINTAVSAHVSQFSQFKKRKPRQGFTSKRATYVNAKLAAQTLANFRVFHSFLEVNALGGNGVQWFQPWMGSVLAAGMQAAGFYRPFFNKSIACSGVRAYYGDFDTTDDDAVEDALLAGLGVIRARDGGGFGFVSDQTTYGADANFVYNSVQATYCADVISQTVAQRMERAFVGQSFADVTAGVALSYLKGIMADLKRLKLIASSDDAVDGYKDASIEIRPPAMLVSAEVKLASGLYYIPISFLVTEVQQTATQG